MKKLLLLFCAIILFIPGCAAREATDAGSALSQSVAGQGTLPEKSESDGISQALRALCDEQIRSLSDTSTLYSSWEGTPIIPEDPPPDTSFTITEIENENTQLTVTAELFGNVYVDPTTMEESIGYGITRIMPREGPTPQLAFGKAIVRFKQSDGSLTPLSCAYEKYAHPGADYLKAQTEKLQPNLSASEKIDVSQYDKGLVNYIWQVLFAHRYIEKPEDITLYDLENLRDVIELPQSSIYDVGAVDSYDPNYRMDASLLRLTPNLESVTCPYRLTDYSVFENMNRLKKLTLYYADDAMFDTIKVGHTDELILYDPDTKLLDLSGVNTPLLRLNSWGTAVGGFTGCEKIEKLYMMSTRTDMRLINAQTFPNATYLNLYFYSEMPRERDFSKLSTFEDTKIDLYLDYQACNNPTLESLVGVKLNDLILDPENGSNPIEDLDQALIARLDTKRTSFESEMYFQERIGDESGSDESVSGL